MLASGLGSRGMAAADCHLPNVISLSVAISACEKGQRGQQALGLLAVTQQAAILPRCISIQPPSVLVRSLQWQQALSLLAVMQQTIVLPGVI